MSPLPLGGTRDPAARAGPLVAAGSQTATGAGDSDSRDSSSPGRAPRQLRVPGGPPTLRDHSKSPPQTTRSPTAMFRFRCNVVVNKSRSSSC
eukprot:768480-Hanusia_phi.AAC.5